MAKAVAPCMFCGNAPCTCNEPPKKPKPATKKKAEPTPAPVVEQVTASPGPMASPMQGAQYSTGIGRSKPKPSTPKRDDSMAYAVECFNLAGMIHEDEKPRLRRMFGETRTPALLVKVKNWRRRNGHGGNAQEEEG